MNTTIYQQAISLLRRERSQWLTGTAYVTDRVMFNMREVTKRARKNYFGIFDEPLDPVTGIEKIWVPLTEWTVESIVQSCDLDTKDINVKALKPSAYSTASIIRQILKQTLKRVRFGELLDLLTRFLAIDGSVVVKSWQGMDPLLRRLTLQTRIVELLNFYIDPSAEDIASTPAVIEGAFLTEDELKSMNGWINLDKVKGKKGAPLFFDDAQRFNSEVPLVDVYERWGKMPKYFITGDEDDKDVWIDGVIVVSGLEDSPVVHLIKANPSGIKPYEESWLRRVSGRWQGRGAAEQLFGLQMNINEIFNIRRNNDLILQNGLFLVRSGSGINQRMISMLRAGGVLPVTDIHNDIKQLAIQDYRAGSYIAEKNVLSLAEKVTFTFPISRGETLPASTPATNAIIQNQNANNSYSLIKETIGAFLQRLIERQWLPILAETTKIGDVINIFDPQEVEMFDDSLIEKKTNEAISKGLPSDKVPVLKSLLKKTLKSYGKNRFIEIDKKIVAEDLGVEIYITNEGLDKSVIIQNLNALLSFYNNLSGGQIDIDAVAKEILDIMGLDGERFLKGDFKDKNANNITNAKPNLADLTALGLNLDKATAINA